MSEAKLETSSHILHLYPSTSGCPYYALAEKANPTSYSPAPLSLLDELVIAPIPDDKGHTFSVKFQNKSIGQIGSSEEDIDQLASFSPQWNDALDSIERTIPSEDTFNPIAAVATGISRIPKLFNSSKPNSDNRSRSSTVTSIGTPNPVAHIVDKVYDQKSSFLVEQKLTLRLATWNVHGEPVQRVNLAGLLGMPVKYDIYAIALQESDPLGPKNLSANNVTLKNTQDAIISTLGGPRSYKIVSSNQLLGIVIVLIASAKVFHHFSNPRTDTTGTGLLGIWGNKGAASIKVHLGADPSVGIVGTELAFLACHLTAGETTSNVDRRRWEFAEIERRLVIQGLSGTAQAPEVVFSGDSIDDHDTDGLPPVQEIADFPISFVLGDLNYRVELDPEVVAEFSHSKEYDTILAHDQLTREMKERRVLNGFTEPTIDFAPTYKYSIGTDTFDSSRQSGSDKARAPSYTDRIFYYPSPMVTPKEYKSIMEYSISDHKPVCASYDLTVLVVDEDKRKSVVQEVLKQSDILENSLRPSIVVEPKELVIRDAKVLELAESEVFIQQQLLIPGNTGRAVEWELVLDSPDITAYPTSGTLPVGAKQYIHFSCTILVKPRKPTTLQAVAVLRIRDAQDIFIPIEFRSLPTSLGKSLASLTRMPQGARNDADCEVDKSNSTNMPREIWNCIDYLWAHAFADIFDEKLAKPEKSIQMQVQDWMDNGQDFDHEVLDTANKVQNNCGVYSVATQFLVLLKHLDGGIVPVEYYPTVLRGREGAMLVS